MYFLHAEKLLRLLLVSRIRDWGNSECVCAAASASWRGNREYFHQRNILIVYLSFDDGGVCTSAQQNKRSVTYTMSRQTRVVDSPPRSVALCFIHNNNNNHNTLSSKRNQNHEASMTFSIQHTIAWWCMMMCYSQFNAISSVCGLRQSDTICHN